MDSRKNEGKRRRKNKRYAEDADYRSAVKERIRSKRVANPEWYLWDKARRRAAQRGLEFNIAVEDVIIPPRCPVLGKPLKVLSSNPTHSASLDRINNRKGYIKGNVAVISHRANTIKGDASLTEIAQLYEWLMKARKK